MSERSAGDRDAEAATDENPLPPCRLAASPPPIVEMRGISKRFGPVVANDDISLSLWEGEIHAVLGENGAGKTTLMNILSGMYQPDAGTIAIRGRETGIASPADALRQGIGTVYQHFTLVPNLSVIENVILGTGSGFVLDLAEAERRLEAMLGDFALNASPRTEVRHLSLGQRQRVEIVKVLFRGSRVLLLDEPTSVLTPVEVDGLFSILLRLKSEGVAVVLITHKLEEALRISDRISILRQGRKVDEIGPAEMANAGRAATRTRIVEAMFGGTAEGDRGTGGQTGRRTDGAPSGPKDRGTDRVLLVLRDVTVRGDRGEEAVRGLSLAVTAGEVFGIAGVDGNGQKELGEAIAGQRHVTHGSVVLADGELTNRGVAVATRAGIGYVTDDRIGEGCVPGMSVADNAILKMVTRRPFSKGIWLNRKAIDAEARELVAAFGVKTPSTATRVTHLSGGNIQKLLLARELAMQPRVLVCNKPTSGLDTRTARFVLRTLRDQADAGRAVLLISSELDDLLAISDRIGVMFNGQLLAIFPRAEADVEKIGHLMLGGAEV